MEFIAFTKSITMSPRKVRLVANTLRNLSVSKALSLLSVERKRAAMPIAKTIKSASSNAVHNAKKNTDALFIKQVEITEGPAYKRFHPSTRGRTHPYKKRTSNIRVVLGEKGVVNV